MRAGATAARAGDGRPTLGARLRAARWWVAVALALGVGFLDLARGGLVLAPILLVVAYLVLVPAALLRR